MCECSFLVDNLTISVGCSLSAEICEHCVLQCVHDCHKNKVNLVNKYYNHNCCRITKPRRTQSQTLAEN